MAKHNSTTMNVTENKTKNDLSLYFRGSVKDPVTGKYKSYVETRQVPPELKGKKEIQEFKLKCELEIKAEKKKEKNGAIVQKNNIRFVDFAKNYVDNILVYNKQAFNYYRTCKGYYKIVEEKLSAYLLSEMTPPVIQNFCKWLCERTYQKAVITVKKSLSEKIAEQKVSLRSVAKGSGIAHSTLFVALQEGKTVSKSTAAKLCKHLDVPVEKYFDTTKKDVPYSWSSNNGLKVFIHGVLHEAVRQRLIDTNFASKDYIRPVTGTKGTKQILDNKDEILKFIKCIETEIDIRKRVAFACYIYLGLRNAEVAGLAWSNIDFENEVISIEQNTMYVCGFGTITKDSKSKKSKRVISVPTALISLLKDYQIWWDNQKINHGDLWEHTDKLFVQNNGRDMNGMTLASWLRDFQERNDLKRVSPHGLRHSNITLQIANGIDIKTVSARAGHNDIQTTLNIYSHYTKEADRHAANKIDELLRA